LFLDFTGVNCPNCRKMERGPLSQQAVLDRLRSFVCVRIYADRVPTISDTTEEERLLEQNLVLQPSWVGDVSLPSYAVVPADPQLAARDERENLLSLLIGYDPDVQHFTNFLDTGYGRWKQLEAQRQGNRVVGQR